MAWADGPPAAAGVTAGAMPADGFELSCFVIVFQVVNRFGSDELRRSGKRDAT